MLCQEGMCEEGMKKIGSDMGIAVIGGGNIGTQFACACAAREIRTAKAWD